jgi:capsular exopolysaccharide synthesis family protein
MSYIFDALQRSESDRSGTTVSVIETATELLERAERQALRQRELETISGDFRNPELTEAKRESLADEARLDILASQPIIPAEEVRNSGRATVCEQFQTILSSPSEESRLVCLTDKDSPAAEAFRLLIVRLRHLRKDKPLKRMLITSTVPQEGKSFAAANLACALASGSQEKILLVEGDLRKPTLRRLFGIKADSGICEYVRGEQSLNSSIYRLDVPGIWLFPSGSAKGDPQEIIQSAKMPSLMVQLSELFDWIVVDSPPLLPLADTTALARLVEGILLVTRREITEKRKLVKGLDAFEKDKLVGVLLNSSNSANDKDYYYYRHQGVDAKQIKVNTD